jgi:hypothetical protein
MRITLLRVLGSYKNLIQVITRMTGTTIWVATEVKMALKSRKKHHRDTYNDVLHSLLNIEPRKGGSQ